MYYRGAQAAVIAFDVHDAKSWEKARDWYSVLRKELDNPDMPIALAANKFDEESGAKTEVDLEEAEAFAREHGVKLFKTSAKTGKGVDEMFAWLAQNLPPPPASATAGAGGAAGAAGGAANASTLRINEATIARPSEAGCC